MADESGVGFEALEAFLRSEFGEDLRSIVQYLPQSNEVIYLREDIDRTAAESRLVRINELYQAERLNSSPITADPELDELHASIHFFDAVMVVHLIDRSGRVLGFSVEGGAPETGLRSVVKRSLEIAFGEAPASVDTG